MHALSVLAARYETGPFRICVHPDPVKQFPVSPLLAELPEPAMFPVQSDEQGMLRARKRPHTFLFDLPTGNFRFSENDHCILKGNIQTGKFSNPGIRIHLKKGDLIYGFGAACDRSHLPCPSSFTLMNQDTLFYGVKGASYSSFPVFWIRSGKNLTAVFVHTSSPASVSLTDSDLVTGDMDLIFSFVYTNGAIPADLFLCKGTPAEISAQISQITGKPFLPPVWSLGYHQSRWSYKSQEEVLTLAGEFRRQDIPLDAIHLDIDYMDRYRVFTWDPSEFPDPESMNNELYEKGVRTVAIVDPGISADDANSIYQEALEKDLLIKDPSGQPFQGRVWPGRTVFPDFTDPVASSWWAEKHEALLLKGVSGIWNDMNEPVYFAGKKTKFREEKTVFRSGTPETVRNLYGNLEAEATMEAFRMYRPEERSFILTRAAAPGMQRYAALWTGDNHSSWDHLKAGLHHVIHLGLSGMPFTGADTGGFAGGKGLFAFLKFRKDPELFVRWMELASVLPFFRNHTIKYSHRQEPWSFGPETAAKVRTQIQRRYLLLPYLYSCMYEAHSTGTPLIRPLFYEFGENTPVHSENQFMIGSRILAAPILEKGCISQNVHLPPGRWTDFHTGKVYKGSASYKVAAPLGMLPLFVKEGSVIPLAYPGRNASETLRGPMILEVYPANGHRTEGYLYWDDGISYDFRKGRKLEIRLRGNYSGSSKFSINAEVDHDGYQIPGPCEIRIQGEWRTLVSGNRKETAVTANAEECGRIAPFSVFRPEIKNATKIRWLDFRTD